MLENVYLELWVLHEKIYSESNFKLAFRLAQPIWMKFEKKISMYI
jgi:hypothetical protein